MSIYLDYNATAPLSQRVELAMRPWFTHRFGNPRSRDHEFGWEANDAVEAGRCEVAAAVGAQPGDIEFCSSATDALELALRSFIAYDGWQRKRVVTSAAEHSSVLNACRYLGKQTGVEITILPVSAEGHVDLRVVSAALGDNKSNLLALTIANSELGTIAPIEQFAALARAHRATFLCDLTQAVGKLPIDLGACDVDLAVFSAHKIHGPKGIGALINRTDKRNTSQVLELRGQGTPNVPGVVGFAEACRMLPCRLQGEMARLARLRDQLESGIITQIDGAWVNGDRIHRLSNTTNIGLRGIDARSFIRYLSDIAISTASACSTGGTRPSHVLKAIGLNDVDARSCVRFSLGRETTQAEIDYTVAKVVASAHAVRRNKSAPARLEG